MEDPFPNYTCKKTCYNWEVEFAVKSRQARLVSAIIAENGEVLWHSAATPQMLFIWGQHDDT
jgi:hypothetical protein